MIFRRKGCAISCNLRRKGAQSLVIPLFRFLGVLSVVMRNVCADEKPDEKWLVLDGPVDTLWIESMNTVMDDNKMLTLISGERIALPPMVTLVFEVQDLAVASPATVSRAGMVFFDTCVDNSPL